jgi:spermidine synthase
MLGARLMRASRRPVADAYVALAAFLAAALPGTVVAVRLGRGMLAIPPGALPSPAGALAFSFLVTAPFCCAYGAIYNAASLLWKERAGGLCGGITRVYLWEAGGAVFGAVFFSFILIEAFSQFQAALVAGGLLAMTAALAASGDRARVSLWAAALIGVFVLGALSPSIDRRSIEAIYPGYRVEEHGSSRYGENVVVEREGLRSVFAGGGRVFSYPEPERCEEMIHIPLLLCGGPRSILLVGSSLGGGLEEALKHPSVERVDCVELDGDLFRAAGAAGESDDRLVRRIAVDGRFFIERGGESYDCVILSSPPPANLQWNRFYTREFFEQVRGVLRPGGVFAFTHPSHENALTAEHAEVLRMIERTLEAVFPRVLVLPGSTAHFIASEADLDARTILPRLRARGIDAPFVGEGYLPFRLTDERLAEMRSSLDRAGRVSVNTDARPVLPLHELLLEGKRTGSRLMAGFGALLRVHPAVIGAAFVLLLLAMFCLARVGPGVRPGARTALAVWSVGLGSFLLQILVLLSYQSFAGMLYGGIVLLTALFMAGASAGAFAAAKRERWGRGALRAIHLGFIALAPAPAIAGALIGSLRLSPVRGSTPFFLMAACAGFLTGAYYGIAVRTALPERSAPAPAALYAWDAFGACAGGLIGGMILFPALGLVGTAACIALLHVLALSLVAGRW